MLKVTLSRWQAAAEREWRLALRVDGVVPMDYERIGIALDALIENALKFTSVGDRITLASAADGRQAIIEVSDTGEGGLAIVKAIVEAHGGTMLLHSRVGHGTSFRVTLQGFEPRLVDGRRAAGRARPEPRCGSAAAPSPGVATRRTGFA